MLKFDITSPRDANGNLAGAGKLTFTASHGTLRIPDSTSPSAEIILSFSSSAFALSTSTSRQFHLQLPDSALLVRLTPAKTRQAVDDHLKLLLLQYQCSNELVLISTKLLRTLLRWRRGRPVRILCGCG